MIWLLRCRARVDWRNRGQKPLSTIFEKTGLKDTPTCRAISAMVIPQSSTNLRETSALTAGISPRRLPLRNSVRGKLYVLCILLQSSAKPSCRGSNYRIARSGLAIIQSSVSLLNSATILYRGEAPNSSSTDKKTGHRSSKLKSTFRHLSISSHAFFDTIFRNQTAIYETLLIRTFLDVPRYWSDLAYALLRFPRVVRNVRTGGFGPGARKGATMNSL